MVLTLPLPDALQHSDPCKAGFVQGDRSGHIDLGRLSAFLELHL